MNATLTQTQQTQEILERPAVRGPEHDPFTMMGEEIAAGLPLMKLQLPECKHEKPCKACRAVHSKLIVGAMDASIKQLHRVHTELRGFFSALPDVIVWPGQGDPHGKHRADKIAELRAEMEMPGLRVPDVMFAQVMAAEVPAIIATFSEALTEGARGTVQGSRDTLEHSQAEGLVGALTWYGPDTCVYHFPRIRRVERKTGAQSSTVTNRVEQRNSDGWGGTWTEFEVVNKTTHFQLADVRERIEHHLYSAARHPFPAPKVRKPRLVEQFLAKIPAFMRHHVFITEGEMLREDIAQTERPVSEREETVQVSREVVRTGVLYSPAVTIADFVLTGWAKTDL